MNSTTWLKAGIGGPAHLVTASGGDFFTSACSTLLRKGTTQEVRTQPVRLDGRDVILPMTLEVCPVCKSIVTRG